MEDVKPGMYYHHKTMSHYRVLFCGTFDDSVTGTREEGVCYIKLNGEGRPQFCTIARFTEIIKYTENTEGPRFRLVDEY